MTLGNTTTTYLLIIVSVLLIWTTSYSVTNNTDSLTSAFLSIKIIMIATKAVQSLAHQLGWLSLAVLFSFGQGMTH